jgi:GNAT superfamily N-acetyltransferase
MTSILTFEQDAVPRALKAQVLAILEVAWPSGRGIEERLDRPLHDPRSAPVCMLLVDGDTVLAYLAIPSKVIQHADVTYRVAGLSSVATHPDHLRRGHGARLVVAARERIAASDADLGIFTCDAPLVAFYEACGWAHMPTTVVVGGTRAQPLRADELGKQTLMGFFSDPADAHRADFADADVYLALREGDLW